MFFVAHRTPATAAACADLARAGAAMFETDVQLSGPSGHVVVSHFLPFRPLSGWLEHDNAQFRRRRVPTPDPALRDVLDLIPADCRVLLDPKETDTARRAGLVAALAAELPDRRRFTVSTDRADDLAAFRAAGFDTWRTIKHRHQLERVVRAGALPDAGVSVRHVLLDAATTPLLHALVPTVVAWTVNHPGRARTLVRLGVDGVTTDRRAVLEDRGPAGG